MADDLIDKRLTPKSLGMWLVIMFGTYIVGTAASAVHAYLMEKTGQALVRDLRCELFAKFEAQSLAYHRDTSTGELVTRITSDVDAMEQSVLQGLTGLLEEIVTFIVVAGMVLWIRHPHCHRRKAGGKAMAPASGERCFPGGEFSLRAVQAHFAEHQFQSRGG